MCLAKIIDNSLQKNCLIVTEIVTEIFWNCDGKVHFVTDMVTERTPSEFRSSQFIL